MTVPTPQGNTMANSATVSILAYCSSSILMTVTNKMVLSQFDFNMNFLLLAFQASEVLKWTEFAPDLDTSKKDVSYENPCDSCQRKDRGPIVIEC